MLLILKQHRHIPEDPPICFPSRPSRFTLSAAVALQAEKEAVEIQREPPVSYIHPSSRSFLPLSICISHPSSVTLTWLAVKNWFKLYIYVSVERLSYKYYIATPKDHFTSNILTNILPPPCQEIPAISASSRLPWYST